MLRSFYFSPAGKTEETARLLAAAIDADATVHNLTLAAVNADLRLAPEDIVMVSVPVYAGRVPAIALERLSGLCGQGQKAIAIVVYGNRDYDDALIELCNTLRDKGLDVVAAGAFIGEHCIFPKVASCRPDLQDKAKIEDFALQVKERIGTRGSLDFAKVKGSQPYKKPAGVPLHPSTDKAKCNRCGQCVSQCPTHSIDAENPTKTNKDTCITCCRCIRVCPQQARSLGGMLYKIAGFKFVKDNSRRLEPEWFI